MNQSSKYDLGQRNSSPRWFYTALQRQIGLSKPSYVPWMSVISSQMVSSYLISTSKTKTKLRQTLRLRRPPRRWIVTIRSGLVRYSFSVASFSKYEYLPSCVCVWKIFLVQCRTFIVTYLVIHNNGNFSLETLLHDGMIRVLHKN